MIKVKHIYEGVSGNDGFRILVDRLWPRGLSKEKACVDLWLKDIAPSGELRKWFSHDVSKWDGFKRLYLDDLYKRYDLIDEIKALEKRHKKVTLLYGAKDKEHNNAVLILSFIRHGGKC